MMEEAWPAGLWQGLKDRAARAGAGQMTDVYAREQHGTAGLERDRGKRGPSPLTGLRTPHLSPGVITG